MPETQSTETAAHFIREIIDNDLGSGHCQTIHTRFPPEPNGYLHIGHAKAICLNFGLAERYSGTCFLRLDDTNPIKEDPEYIDAIKDDVEWLGFRWDGPVRYASDYFEAFYTAALELIEKGLAYVDELPAEAMRSFRGTLTEAGVNSPYRDRSTEENRRLFEQMRAGKFVEGTACLRAKIDMASSFMVLRDPVLYRIRFIEHHQTGSQWCIYPMYDFAHPLSDAFEGITHSLCTLEFQDNRRLYDWILEHVTVPSRPRQYEFSRLNLEYTLMSKRALQQLVSEKIVMGWDDPRMPTLSGLRRKGVTPYALRLFCSRIGVTKQANLVEMSLLDSCIREDLHVSAPRAMAVLNPLKVILENFPSAGTMTLIVPCHPEYLEQGSREMPINREIYIDRADFQEVGNKHYKRLVLGKEVRLRHAYVVRATRIEKDEAGIVQTVYCTLDLETLGRNPADGHKVRGVIHWVSVNKALPAEFHLYEPLFTVRDPGALENFLEAINPNSVLHQQGFVEPYLAEIPFGKVYQFEREGYFCRDQELAPGGRVVFNRTVALRDASLKQLKASD